MAWIATDKISFASLTGPKIKQEKSRLFRRNRTILIRRVVLQRPARITTEWRVSKITRRFTSLKRVGFLDSTHEL